MDHYVLQPEQNTFKSLVVDITHRCNMKCSNCYIPNRQIPDMDEKYLYKFLQRLPAKTYIRLIGAEPTMRDDLPDIIRTIKKLGHHVSLTTNGLKLDDYQYVQELWDAGLKMFLISMNGGVTDKYYKALDSGKYAARKVKALDNLFKIKAFINIGCILAKELNEPALRQLIQLVDDSSTRHKYKFTTPWKSPCIRVKTVSAIGRYMEGRSYTFKELTEVIASELNTTPEALTAIPCMSGTNPTVKIDSSGVSQGWVADEVTSSYMYPVEIKMGTMYLRLIDWTVSEFGVPNANNRNRGRVTKDWKIAPFFEDIKMNEFGY